MNRETLITNSFFVASRLKLNHPLKEGRWQIRKVLTDRAREIKKEKFHRERESEQRVNSWREVVKKRESV